MRNVGADYVITQAFRTAHFKISGAPDWAAHELYDVEAKMAPEIADALQKLTPNDEIIARQHMMQVLVKQYLKAEVHMETTEVAAFDLVVAKNGPKLTEVTDPAMPDQGFRASQSQSGVVLKAMATRLELLIPQFSRVAGRPVFDKTGLTGRYDFTLRYALENLSATAPGSADAAPPPSDAPPLAKALEEQLGLKLVPSRGNMDVIVIDHVERPPRN
jgi:uncharacterized protein (TIGR03435 family)